MLGGDQMAPRNYNDDRDRSVPPEEDYYGRAPIDLDFNSRENKRGEPKIEEEDGINPTLEYDRYYREQDTQKIYNQQQDIRQTRPQQRHDYPDSRNDDLRYSPRSGKKDAESNRRTAGSAKAKAKKKGGKAPKILSAVVAVVLVIVMAGVGMVETVLGKINYDEKEKNAYVSASELQSSRKVTNILLLGVDARSEDKDEASRADTMMLISFDGENNCVKITSFLRDTWVYIPVADKKQRLNAACTYGGYSGVADTIEYNFGIEIDGYVVADFEMFKVMVDSIGGVEVEVTEKEAKEVTNHPGRYGNVKLDAGTYTLTGEQALAYCRIRKIDTDWKRTERQRTVIQAIIKGVLSSGPIGAYKAASNVAPYIETDLTKGEIRSLALRAVPCLTGGFEQTSCPFEGTWEYANHGGASVIDLNVYENKDKLIDFIYSSNSSENE